ncbi:hypothetical protein GF358_01505 [Candidatus Woesearchaeota archaeon]|nr:hypothetical protein [Candidatus Woesearchaeota archaeon]
MGVKMRRKVIQIADSTQLISLPRKWAQKRGIKKGDELEVNERGNSIVISTDRTPGSMEKIIDVSGLTPRLTDRFLARAYQKGYDKLTFYFDDQEKMKAIQHKVPELLGFEIMNHTKNNCTVQSISTNMQIDFNSALRQVFRIIKEMAEICLDSYKEGNKIALNNVESRDYDVNKFAYYCLRTINKTKAHEGGNATMLYYLLESLEDVGDEYKILAKYLAKLKQNDPLFVSLISKLNEITKLAYEFFYNPKKKNALSIMNLRKEIEDSIEKKLVTKNINEIKALLAMKSIVTVLYHIPTMRLDTIKELDIKK